MRFILLGSGEIAELFLLKPEFEGFIDQNLIAIAGTEELLKCAHERYKNLDSTKTINIGEKIPTEKALSELIKTTDVDFVLSIQYPWILSGGLLSLTSHRVLNLHNARLPDYRGHNSISHEILNGESEHTTTLHWVAEEVDRGQIVATRSIPIEDDDTAYSLWSRSVDSALVLMKEFVENSNETVVKRVGTSVPEGGHYYSKNQIAHLKEIPGDATLDEIDRIARAFWFPPHEPAHFVRGERKLYVLPNSVSYSV
jgi:methionyl-tRNA formyltransferase